MGLLQGLYLGDYMQTIGQRQEEAKLRAALFQSQAKHLDAQSKLIELNVQKGQALAQKLRDVLTSSTAGTAETPQGGPQDAAPPAPTYEQEQPDMAPTPDQQGQSLTQRLTPPVDEAQQRLAFAKKYNLALAPQDEQAQGQFVQRYGPQATPQTALPSAPALNQDADQGTSPEAVLEAPTGSGAVAPAPRARPSAAQRLSTTPGPSDQDDDTMLRNLAKAYFVNERPELGLKIWGYADQQRRLREAATFYRNLLQHPQVDEDTRRGALAGLGGLMIQAGKVDEAMKMLRPYVPLTVREAIEKTSSTTRNVLMEQIERGEQPSIAKANAEAQRRKAKR